MSLLLCAPCFGLKGVVALQPSTRFLTMCPCCRLSECSLWPALGCQHWPPPAILNPLNLASLAVPSIPQLPRHAHGIPWPNVPDESQLYTAHAIEVQQLMANDFAGTFSNIA